MTGARAGIARPRTWWLQTLGVLAPGAVVLLSAPGPFRWSVGAGLAACVLLPLRNRWPWLAVLGCVPGLLGGLGWPAAMVALYTLGRRSGRRVPTLHWAALCGLAAVIPVFLTQLLHWRDVLLTLIAAAFYSGAPAVLGMLITTREQLQDSLRDLQAAREATMAAREEVARAAERDRIGREIHDAVGHHATMIAVGAAALAATSKDEQTREAAERLRVLAKRALAEMRAALGLIGNDSEVSAGIAALPDLVERARESGMRVELIGADKLGDDLPLGVERTVYRLVQESLTNAAKHAEGADVEVRLERWATELRVTVTNGPPPRPKLILPASQRGGGGLAGLAERIGMQGGRLRARPTSQGGFTVQGRLPTPPLDKDSDSFARARSRRKRSSDAAEVPGGDRANHPKTDQPKDAPRAESRSSGATSAEPATSGESNSQRATRETKVAIDEATKDGSAAERARAH